MSANALMTTSTLALVAAMLAGKATPEQEAEIRRRAGDDRASLAGRAKLVLDGSYPLANLVLLHKARSGDAAAAAAYKAANQKWIETRNSERAAKPAKAKPAAAPAAEAKPVKVSATLAAINALAADFQSFRAETTTRFERIEAELAKKANSRAKRG
ncbi:MAG: hypothetical protein IM674_09850 [Brevundimonas sp.]|nr:hypothetical protein [Brevundimonas sp.]